MKHLLGLGRKSINTIDPNGFINAQGLIDVRRLIDTIVKLGHAQRVTRLDGSSGLDMAPEVARTVGSLVLRAAARAEVVQMRNRVAPGRFGGLVFGALDIAVWFLPPAERLRYTEEYRAEFCEVAQGSPLSRLGYLVRLVCCAPFLGRELRRAAHETVSDR